MKKIPSANLNDIGVINKKITETTVLYFLLHVLLKNSVQICSWFCISPGNLILYSISAYRNTISVKVRLRKNKQQQNTNKSWVPSTAMQQSSFICKLQWPLICG